MGLFDDFGIDIDEIEELEGFSNPADGVYRFEVASGERRDGSTNNPDNTFFVIEFNLETEDGEAAGTKQDWYTMAVDGDPDVYPAPMSLKFLKSRLLELGVPGSKLSKFEGGEIEGVTGTLQLKTKPGKNGKAPSQNIYNVKRDPDKPKAEPVKRAATRKPAVKPKAAPVEESSEDDEDDNPFGG